MNKHHKVALVTDMDAIIKELTPQPMWLVRPQLNRKYPEQRMLMTAEVVDLTTISLAKLRTFEIL